MVETHPMKQGINVPRIYFMEKTVRGTTTRTISKPVSSYASLSNGRKDDGKMYTLPAGVYELDNARITPAASCDRMQAVPMHDYASKRW